MRRARRVGLRALTPPTADYFNYTSTWVATLLVTEKVVAPILLFVFFLSADFGAQKFKDRIKLLDKFVRIAAVRVVSLRRRLVVTACRRRRSCAS